MWTRGERRMNETIFENLPQKMNLISDLFSRVFLCQDLVQVKMRNFSHFNLPKAQP